RASGEPAGGGVCRGSLAPRLGSPKPQNHRSLGSRPATTTQVGGWRGPPHSQRLLLGGSCAVEVPAVGRLVVGKAMYDQRRDDDGRVVRWRIYMPHRMDAL